MNTNDWLPDDPEWEQAELSVRNNAQAKGGKPDWLAQWVWDQTLDAACRAIHYDKELVAFCFKLAGERDLLVLWNAIASRQKTLKAHGAFSDSGPAEGLLFVAFHASRGITGHDAFSGTHRRAISKNIGALTERLVEALQEISVSRDPPGFSCYPLEVENSLQGFASTTIDRATSSNEEFWVLYKSDEDWPEHKNFMKLGAQVYDIKGGLLALKEGIEQWARTQPPVTQINHETAGRRLFIRYMTKYFKLWYQTPLRECVAALTRIIYACDMDAATVAKLAP